MGGMAGLDFLTGTGGETGGVGICDGVTDDETEDVEEMFDFNPAIAVSSDWIRCAS